MSVHLVGGGWQEEPDGAASAAFVAEAAGRAATSVRDMPRIAVVAVRDGDRDLLEPHFGELTALIVGDGGLRVAGHGSVWRALPAESGVLVSTIGA